MDNYEEIDREREEENLFKEMMKKEMIRKLEDRINNQDKDIIKALKSLIEDDDVRGSKF